MFTRIRPKMDFFQIVFRICLIKQLNSVSDIFPSFVFVAVVVFI